MLVQRHQSIQPNTCTELLDHSLEGARWFWHSHLSNITSPVAPPQYCIDWADISIYTTYNAGFCIYRDRLNPVILWTIQTDLSRRWLRCMKRSLETLGGLGPINRSTLTKRYTVDRDVTTAHANPAMQGDQRTQGAQAGTTRNIKKFCELCWRRNWHGRANHVHRTMHILDVISSVSRPSKCNTTVGGWGSLLGELTALHRTPSWVSAADFKASTSKRSGREEKEGGGRQNDLCPGRQKLSCCHCSSDVGQGALEHWFAGSTIWSYATVCSLICRLTLVYPLWGGTGRHKWRLKVYLSCLHGYWVQIRTNRSSILLQGIATTKEGKVFKKIILHRKRERLSLD